MACRTLSAPQVSAAKNTQQRARLTGTAQMLRVPWHGERHQHLARNGATTAAAMRQRVRVDYNTHVSAQIHTHAQRGYATALLRIILGRLHLVEAQLRQQLIKLIARLVGLHHSQTTEAEIIKVVPLLGCARHASAHTHTHTHTHLAPLSCRCAGGTRPGSRQRHRFCSIHHRGHRRRPV